MCYNYTQQVISRAYKNQIKKIISNRKWTQISKIPHIDYTNGKLAHEKDTQQNH